MFTSKGGPTVEDMEWNPERKVVGAAIATLIFAVLQVTLVPDVPVGVEGALAVVVAYFLPNKK